MLLILEFLIKRLFYSGLLDIKQSSQLGALSIASYLARPRRFPGASDFKVQHESKATLRDACLNRSASKTCIFRRISAIRNSPHCRFLTPTCRSSFQNNPSYPTPTSTLSMQQHDKSVNKLSSSEDKGRTCVNYISWFHSPTVTLSKNDRF